MEQLKQLAPDGYDRLIGLELGDMSLDGCTTKAPGDAERAGTSPVDRGKTGTQALHRGRRCRYPLRVLSAPANCHDSPLLAPTLDLLAEIGPLPKHVTVHLDRGYDSTKTRQELRARGLHGAIAQKGKPTPIQAGMRWSGCTLDV